MSTKKPDYTKEITDSLKEGAIITAVIHRRSHDLKVFSSRCLVKSVDPETVFCS